MGSRKDEARSMFRSEPYTTFLSLCLVFVTSGPMLAVTQEPEKKENGAKPEKTEPEKKDEPEPGSHRSAPSSK